MAIEEGTHNITNYDNTSSRIVEASSFTLSKDYCWQAESTSTRTYAQNYRNFQNSWSSIPAVWHTIMTANDNDTITSYGQNCGTSSSVWTSSCVEIGLNGLENDAPSGGLQPCTEHTSDETGGYIAWEIVSGYNSELCNSYETGNKSLNYTYELCWESDNVLGSQNDVYDIGNYYVTLSKSYSKGVCISSNTEIDGGNGLYPVTDYDDGSDKCYFLAEEDQNGDEEQTHTDEPWLTIFFNDTNGYIFEQIIEGANEAPSVDSVSLSYTGTPTNIDNISISYSVSDPENDPLFNITNWKVNSLSIFLTLVYFEIDNGLITTEHSGRLGYNLNSTTATHTSSGGHDGRGAFTFDGSSEYLNLDDSNSASSNVFDKEIIERTVILWYKATDVSGTNYQILYEEGGGTNGANIYIYDSNVYAGAWSESDSWNGQWATTSTSSNVWHMVALIIDAPQNRISIYQDGTFVTKTDSFPKISGHIGNDFIGYCDSSVPSPNTGGSGSLSSGNYFSGTIDDFIVIDRAVSKTQLDEIYNSNGKFDKITYDSTRKGEVWNCEIKTYDGDLYSLSSTSNSITIENTAPNILSVEFDDDDSVQSNEIDLIPNSTQKVYCNAIVNDIDKGNDISSGSGKLYLSSVGPSATDDNRNHYSNSSCNIDSNYGNINQSSINCTFEILFYADYGDWQCQITADDGSSSTINYGESTSYLSQLMAISLNNTNINFGSLKIGENSTTNYKSVKIKNLGNTNFDINLESFGNIEDDGKSFACTSGTILDIYLRYDTSGTLNNYKDFTSSNSGTGKDIDSFNLQKQTTGTSPTEKEVRFGLGIPSGVAGTCNGNIIITSISDI